MSWAQVPTFKRDAQGRVFVNPDKDFIYPIDVPTDAPNQVITLPANTRMGPYTLTAQHDGPIEFFYLKVVVKNDRNEQLTNYDIDFFLEHSGKRKYLMNRDIPLIACAGDAGRPFVLPETIFLPARQSLQVTFNNLDSGERRVEFVMGGIKYYPNAAPSKTRDELWTYTERREKTYTYFLTTDAEIELAASETQVSAIATMPDDTDLEILKLTAKADGLFRLSIRDLSTSRSLTGGQQILSNLVFGGHLAVAMGGGLGGSGGVHPARWATSLLMRRSTQLELVLDELSGTKNIVKPVFAGRKIAYAS